MIEYQICSKCQRKELLEIEISPGHFIGTCNYCDAPDYIYLSHCWKCKTKIDSRVCTLSKLPDMGYYCPNPNCQKDLSELKISRGEITLPQLMTLQRNAMAQERGLQS